MTATAETDDDEQADPPAKTGRKVRGLDADQRRARRRADLLAAALQLFAERGHPNVSIEEICQTAYVGTKSFYELFDGKQECFFALFEQLSDTVDGCLRAALHDVGGSSPTDLDDVVRAFAHNLAADPRLLTVTFGESATISPAVDRQRRLNRRRAATIISEIWHQYGVIDTDPTPDTRGVAVGAIGGLFDIISDWLHDHDPTQHADIDQLADELVSFHRIVRAGLSTRQ